MPQDMRVNVDAIGWEVPNSVAGQPPVYMTHTRGEVVAVPDHILAQKKVGTPEVEKILVHYPPAPGDTIPRARYEPVLVSPDAADDEVATAAAVRARVDELEQELATLRAQAPPAPAPLTAGLGPRPVVLTPTVTGVRMIATPEEAAADPILAAGARMTGRAEAQEEPPPLGGPGTPPTPEAHGTPPAMTTPNPNPVGADYQPPPPPAPLAQTGAQVGAPRMPPDLANASALEITRLLNESPDLADAVEAAEQRRPEPRTTVLQAVSRARSTVAGRSDDEGEGGQGES